MYVSVCVYVDWYFLIITIREFLTSINPNPVSDLLLLYWDPNSMWLGPLCVFRCFSLYYFCVCSSGILFICIEVCESYLLLCLVWSYLYVCNKRITKCMCLWRTWCNVRNHPRLFYLLVASLWGFPGSAFQSWIADYGHICLAFLCWIWGSKFASFCFRGKGFNSWDLFPVHWVSF